MTYADPDSPDRADPTPSADHADGLSFCADDDRYLQRHFGRQAIDQIALARGRSAPAMLYRARRIGLRRAVRYYDADDVAQWLCLDPQEWPDLERAGVERYGLPDRRGIVRRHVVSATSLARWLMTGRTWYELVRERGADEYFCRDVIESAADVQRRAATWEGCKFLGPDHVCMNPFAGSSYGLFCTNNERHAAGEDPKCNVRGLKIEDMS